MISSSSLLKQTSCSVQTKLMKSQEKGPWIECWIRSARLIEQCYSSKTYQTLVSISVRLIKLLNKFRKNLRWLWAKSHSWTKKSTVPFFALPRSETWMCLSKRISYLITTRISRWVALLNLRIKESFVWIKTRRKEDYLRGTQLYLILETLSRSSSRLSNIRPLPTRKNLKQIIKLCNRQHFVKRLTINTC